MANKEKLPFVDEHSQLVDASQEDVWIATMKYVEKMVKRPAPAAFAALWKLEPRSGFAIAEEVSPKRLVLKGHHRFARYELTFEIEPTANGSSIKAVTSAVFPGIAGRVYRAAVIGSGGHTFVARRLLNKIGRMAES